MLENASALNYVIYYQSQKVFIWPEDVTLDWILHNRSSISHNHLQTLVSSR